MDEKFDFVFELSILIHVMVVVSIEVAVLPLIPSLDGGPDLGGFQKISLVLYLHQDL